jgi:hypothetical protein
MKTYSASMRRCVLVFAALWFHSAQADPPNLYAQNRYRRPNYTRPPQSTNQTTKARSEEKPQKFRDLAVGAEYYYLADKDRKLFPWRKVSPTHAQSLPTPGRTNSTLAAVPGELLVVVKKDSPKESKDKNKEGNKKENPPAKKEEPKKQ